MLHEQKLATLHAISAWMAAHPAVSIDDIDLTYDPINVTVYDLHNRKDAQQFVHDVGGKVDKTEDYGLIYLKHQPEGADFVVRGIVNQSALCTSRVVGKKTVRVPTEWKDEEQDVVEWNCDPIMGKE